MLDAAALPAALESLQACDASEASLSTAARFLETPPLDAPQPRPRADSRADTPLNVGAPTAAAAAAPARRER